MDRLLAPVDQVLAGVTVVVEMVRFHVVVETRLAVVAVVGKAVLQAKLKAGMRAV